jgi:hypothetical protein
MAAEYTGSKPESTTTRKAGVLDFRPWAGKTKARQGVNRCGLKTTYQPATA